MSFSYLQQVNPKTNQRQKGSRDLHFLEPFANYFKYLLVRFIRVSTKTSGTETWQPETLQIMNDHGFSPEDFKEEEELNTEEEPEGEFLILLRFYPFADMTCHWH